jgi:hypothetical protein
MRIVGLSMLRHLATPLQVLMLVMIFLMSSFGHHVSVAASDNAHGHHASVAMDHGAHGASGECKGAECSQSAIDCCLMGQCMLAAPLHVSCALALPEKAVLAGARASTLHSAVRVVPFRPPALA